MNTNKKKRVVSIMLCVAMLAPMASMAMSVGAQGEDAFTSSSVDTQKDKGECSICEAGIIDGSGGQWGYSLDGNKYYTLGNGEMAVGWVKIDGNFYYFYEDGAREGQMAVDWVEIDGEEYYFDEDEDREGQMAVVGFSKIYGKFYYFDEDEDGNIQMAVGWREIDDERYYFDEDEDRKGQMAVGWRVIDGEEYYFDEDEAREGQMAVGWVEIDGKNYYFYEDEARKGQMAVGWYETRAGSKYYFTESEGSNKGVLKTGWFTEDGNDSDNKWYYAKTAEDVKVEGGYIGEVVTGEWKDSYGNKYYFVEEDGNGRKKGELFTGWRSNGGKRYYYSENTNNDEKRPGKMQKGLIYVMDKDAYNGEYKLIRYYLDEETGAIHTGWLNDKSGATYFFARTSDQKFKEGEMVTGWLKDYDSVKGVCRWYYLDKETGAMHKGWLNDESGATYFFADGEGEMVVGLVEIDGNFYYFDEDEARKGQMVVGWFEDSNGNKLYSYEEENKKGQIAVGLVEIYGKDYYFYLDGNQKVKMAKKYKIDIDGITYYFNEEGVCTYMYVTED